MINKLNREQESLLGVYREKWTNIGLSCDPCDFGEAKSAAIEAYAAAGLPPPEMFFRFRSPVSAAIGTAIIKELMRVKGAGAMTSVGASVRDSVGASVWASVRDSVGAYTGSFFRIPVWKYVKHHKGKYPYQPLMALWKTGLVPSFDGTTWRLHGGPKAAVLFSITAVKLKKYR